MKINIKHGYMYTILALYMLYTHVACLMTVTAVLKLNVLISHSDTIKRLSLRKAATFHCTPKVVDVHIASLQMPLPSVEREGVSCMRHSSIVEYNEVSWS